MSKTTTTINIPGGIVITIAAEDPPSLWVTKGDLETAIGPLNERIREMETATEAVLRETQETNTAVNDASAAMSDAAGQIAGAASAIAQAVGLIPALKQQMDVAVAAAQGNNPALLEAANMLDQTQSALGNASQQLVQSVSGLAQAAQALNQAVVQATPAAEPPAA